MQCKGCGYSHSEIVYTRHDEKRNLINRRRQCLKCGLRFTTAEQLKEPRKPNDDKLNLGNVK